MRARLALIGDDVIALLCHRETYRTRSNFGGAQNSARLFEIGRSIDTQWHRVNERNIDTHTRLKGAQLLKALAAF